MFQEVQRHSNMLPLGVPRSAAVDARLGEYTIPKGTQVFQNMTSVHFDPELFPDPHRFDPTRYLATEDGGGEKTRFVPSPHVLPFGTGRRRCLGEVLAKPSLYLFFTGITARFETFKIEQKILFSGIFFVLALQVSG